MTLECLDAFPAGNDHGYAIVFHFLTDGVLDFLHVLGKGHYNSDVGGFHAYSGADTLKFARAGGVLASGHTGREVVGDDDHHVGVAVYAVKQAGDA